MTTTKGTVPTIYHVTGTQLHLIDKHLDSAVERAVQQAVESGARNGILVSRDGPGSFTVASSGEVPSGKIRERAATNGALPPGALH